MQQCASSAMKAKRSSATDTDKTERMAMAAIEEARMVLPGIQALFGFQLIAVFNEAFRQLEPGEQLLHFLSLVLVAVAIAIIMTPAAYNRLVERGSLSDFFVRLALVPLMIAVCVQVYLLGRVILHGQWISAAVAAFLLIIFSGLWYAFPFAMLWLRSDGHR
jgi:hypothetical protein